MGIGIAGALLLCCAASLASALYDPEVCSRIKDSYGLIPPVIPRNLEYRAEYVDYVSKKVTHAQIHLDYTRSRGKQVLLQDGVEYHSLYDYHTQQIVKYHFQHPGARVHPDMGHDCHAVDMEDSGDRLLFGYMDEDSEYPKMYSGAEHLHFGGPYPHAANGSDRLADRGLKVTKYTGCVYDDYLFLTMRTNFSFTDEIVLSSGGTTMEQVSGFQDGLVPVPVRMDAFGVILPQDDSEPLVLNRTEHFYWFQGEPEFQPDTFKIPRSLFCKDYRGRKEMPAFPTAFSTRLQKTRLSRGSEGGIASQEVASFEQIFYSKQDRLARRDFTPVEGADTDIYAKFGNYAPVKTIYDFNQGVVYITNKPSGRCFARPIISGDFFENADTPLAVQMADPAHIFQMDTEGMEYKGTAFARDIECDVWSGIQQDKEHNITYVKETHISTNGWHEEVEEDVMYGVPVEHAIYNVENAVVGLYYIPFEYANSYSFLKFKPSPPPLFQFDVSNCVDAVGHRNFVLFLVDDPTVRQLILDYERVFMDNIQYYLTHITQVGTPLRIQRLLVTQVSLSDPRLIVHFTVLDKTPLKTPVPVGEKGASLMDAVGFLHDFVWMNQFAMPFQPPGVKERTLVTALQGSLYVKSSDGDLQAPLADYVTPTVQSADDVKPEVHFSDDDIDDEEVEYKGMSSGNLALLACAMAFIGVGIGICIMYLYVRMFSESQMDDRIQLTLGKSMEVPGPSTSAEAEP